MKLYSPYSSMCWMEFSLCCSQLWIYTFRYILFPETVSLILQRIHRRHSHIFLVAVPSVGIISNENCWHWALRMRQCFVYILGEAVLSNSQRLKISSENLFLKSHTKVVKLKYLICVYWIPSSYLSILLYNMGRYPDMEFCPLMDITLIVWLKVSNFFKRI